MPTQANVLALTWHYTVLWHRSTVHPAAWAGLQLVTSWEQRGWRKKKCIQGPRSHLLRQRPRLASSFSLSAAGVKWLSSTALHCHSALQPAMDGIHFALACLPSKLRWDCRQSLPNTTVLLVSALPSLLPTKAKLRARHYRIRLRPETALRAVCRVAVEVSVCYNSSVTAMRINRLWYPGITVELIDCVWVQPRVCLGLTPVLLRCSTK